MKYLLYGKAQHIVNHIKRPKPWKWLRKIVPLYIAEVQYVISSEVVSDKLSVTCAEMLEFSNGESITTVLFNEYYNATDTVTVTLEEGNIIVGTDGEDGRLLGVTVSPIHIYDINTFFQLFVVIKGCNISIRDKGKWYENATVYTIGVRIIDSDTLGVIIYRNGKRYRQGVYRIYDISKPQSFWLYYEVDTFKLKLNEKDSQKVISLDIHI